MPDPDQAARDLREAAGPFVRPLQALVRSLRESRGIPELVAATGMPRREVEQALAAMDPDLEKDGDRYRLASSSRRAYADVFADRREPPEEDHLTERLEELFIGRPAPDRDLDHVAATVRTAARRALWLDETYDLTATELLCVGDHDLTAIAVAACTPGARVTVVDLDERVLEFIDGVARKHGWSVRTRWGDFRLGLPASVRGSAGLVFTDPPYTAEGVATFLVAGLQGLADTGRGRLLLAYGTGDHQPALGLKVQQEILGMQIAIEAMLPGFHRYEGAQAIGSRSDLYVLRPTARTWRALPSLVKRETARLYTHGERSLESGSRAAATSAFPDVSPDGRVLVVGDWPDVPASAQRVTAGALITAGLPKQLQGKDDVTALLDLGTAPGAWLLRAVLAADVRDVVAVIPAGAWGQAWTDLLRGYRDVAVRPSSDPRSDVLSAPRVEVPTGVVPRVLARTQARLANVWRESLIATARERGADLTRNEARAVIDRTCSVPDVLAAHLGELPEHLLTVVLGDIHRSDQNIALR